MSFICWFLRVLWYQPHTAEFCYAGYGVFNGGHFAFSVASLPPLDIPGFFQLPYSGTDSRNVLIHASMIRPFCEAWLSFY